MFDLTAFFIDFSNEVVSFCPAFIAGNPCAAVLFGLSVYQLHSCHIYRFYPFYVDGKLNIRELERVCGLIRSTVYKYLVLME